MWRVLAALQAGVGYSAPEPEMLLLLLLPTWSTMAVCLWVPPVRYPPGRPKQLYEPLHSRCWGAVHRGRPHHPHCWWPLQDLSDSMDQLMGLLPAAALCYQVTCPRCVTNECQPVLLLSQAALLFITSCMAQC